MSLQFTQASTNKVTVTNPLTIGSGSAISYLQWVRQRTGPANSQGTGKGNVDLSVFITGVGWFMEIPRATTPSYARVTDATLFPVNDEWTYVVFTYSEANGVRIYRGTLTTAPAEVTYNGTQVGSGATSADSGDLWIGNRNATSSLAPSHDIAVTMLFNAELTLAEVTSLWMHPRKIASCVMYHHLGFNGTGTQPDWSGNGNNGTVTGTVINEHVPLRPPFGAFSRTSTRIIAAGGSPVIEEYGFSPMLAPPKQKLRLY